MSLDEHFRRRRHDRLNKNLTEFLQPEAEMIFIDSAAMLPLNKPRHCTLFYGLIVTPATTELRKQTIPLPAGDSFTCDYRNRELM